MRKLLALGAAAALTIVGIGAASTAAQAEEVGTSQVTTIKISEVLINTAPNATTPALSGVEVVKPTGQSIDTYRIQVCDSAGTLTTVTTLDTAATDRERTASASIIGYDYFVSGPMYRDGGVRLVDGVNVIDAVTFNNTNSNVDTCLKSGDSTPVTPAVAPAPTDTRSPQRDDDPTTGPDTGSFPTIAALPTFSPTSGAPN